jgi:LacI family transcriptional regulator
MNTRVTLKDIAARAGVSSATVDRVMNDRKGVHQRTRDAVMVAARALGYFVVDDGPQPGLPEQVLDLVFLLPEGTNTFMKLLAAHLERQAAVRPEVNLRIEWLKGFDPATVAGRLAELQGRIDGLALIALDDPQVREGIRALAASGVPVVTMVSDIQTVHRVGYVGIDNRQAGRLAGHLMGRFVTESEGKVALFAGSTIYRGHEEREAGFRSILRAEHPGLTIVDMREIQDDRDRAFAEAKDLLRRHPDLAGIYNMGAGTYGIARALKEADLGRRIALIGHEATDGNKALLLDGTIDAVIDQNPRVEAREALNLLTATARGDPYEMIPLRLQVVFKENLPFD